MNTLAVVFEQPEQLSVRAVELVPATDADVVVAMRWSGISTGTEKLLFTGRMPPFPGLGYPLVPGYEGVGEIVAAGPASERTVGQRVYVAGSRGFVDARGLFGGQAATVVVHGQKTIVLNETVGERGTLLALAATAYHMLGDDPLADARQLPELIVGHGALGRLIARLVLLIRAQRGESDMAPPTVWETNPIRQQGANGYPVVHPDADERRNYRTICDVSGANGLLDTLIARLAPGGEICLGGFYSDAVAFTFPPAFLREARIRIAAQWKEADLHTVADLANRGLLNLHDLITHHAPAVEAADAYATAFGDPHCVKMILDWRSAA